MSADIVLLDRLLVHYGPETKDARVLLRSAVGAGLEWFRPAHDGRTASLEPTGAFEAIYDKIEELSPQSEAQRSLQGQALNMAINLGRTRLLLFENASSSIPSPFLLVLVFWLTIIFASFGLFAPRNATAIAAVLVFALSVSGAIFLILELDRRSKGSFRCPAPRCTRRWRVLVRSERDCDLGCRSSGPSATKREYKRQRSCKLEDVVQGSQTSGLARVGTTGKTVSPYFAGWTRKRALKEENYGQDANP